MEHYIILSTILFFVTLVGFWFGHRLIASWLFCFSLTICWYLYHSNQLVGVTNPEIFVHIALANSLYTCVCGVFVTLIGLFNLYCFFREVLFCWSLSRFLGRNYLTLFTDLVLLLILSASVVYLLLCMRVNIFLLLLGCFSLVEPINDGPLMHWPVEELVINAMKNEDTSINTSKTEKADVRYIGNSDGAYIRNSDGSITSCVRTRDALHQCCSKFNFFGINAAEAVDSIWTSWGGRDLICTNKPPNMEVKTGFPPASKS